MKNSKNIQKNSKNPKESGNLNETQKIKDFVLVIPNIRSSHNVGSLFRTADAMGVTKIYLCGYTPGVLNRFGHVSRPQKEIAKTALGAEKTVPFEYMENLKKVIRHLKKCSIAIFGLEQHEDSINLNSKNDIEKIDSILKYGKIKYTGVALVLGEEVSGLTKKDISLMDYLVEIPMHGKKESMNVSVAGGIAMHVFRQIIDNYK